ncbi:putative cAMP-binding protein-catabolite gene activator and regulatory subunit of cAMP-dependent protein kinase [Magnetospirillum sp. XM-1]|uniref:Crp/Fnr family transcriptional regulator n=1 Tax=Magnetospirillum sp. XM-1 TaxID=1663591 RepID=UPI00073DEA75|nr:Crp/Fnr family transcriptional regulator [Magnetospirillum sp. XM-1]CUW39092.1 putative cAMP-binding protein-catabolite gene activator and regulatory subunit of cAMP-dependent protein kinase [Magnetospirillum sp. XM-1]
MATALRSPPSGPEEAKATGGPVSCPCRPSCEGPTADCDRTLTTPQRVFKGSRSAQEVVAALPLFDGILPDVLNRLLADSATVARRRSTLLFGAGDEADCFYIVLDGAVKLFALAQDGRESIVEIFGPGTSFAEAAMLSTGRFPLHAEVIEDATLIRVGRRAFLYTLHSDHALAYRMLAALAKWNRRLASEISDLKGLTPWQRVAEFLLAQAPAAEGRVEVLLPFNKEVLASRVGIRRESLSRVLGRLRVLGVHTSGNAVRIDDVDLLRRACFEAAGGRG